MRFYPGDKVIIDKSGVGTIIDLEYENDTTIYAVVTESYAIDDPDFIKEEIAAVYATSLMPYNDATRILYLGAK